VGTIEGLNSLCTFAFNYPQYKYPVVATNNLSISATQLAHPLIPAEKSVANDAAFGIDEQLVLVTGSNMSGKTTFLRSIGVNLILAQCGAPVCATSFIFTPMVIRSSIRVSDSLQEQTSYFMAELKRLQQIIHYLQQQTAPVLILIDEILRGTNSEDKTHGSEQFIKKLLQYRCLTLFATHDLTLSRLEEEMPGKVNNYCFESTINNGELLFDYKLQRGVAKNKNASFLMEKMEII
jgi:DNA mismatch repair ATPase MutS